MIAVMKLHNLTGLQNDDPAVSFRSERTVIILLVGLDSRDELEAQLENEVLLPRTGILIPEEGAV
jgi:hypothetical protein